MDKLVNFKLAKLLKEKRFNEPCDSWYYNDGSYHNNPTKWINSELAETNYSAPTIAEVVMWVYKKYGIWISAKPYVYGENWFSQIEVASEKLWQDLDKRHSIITATKKFPSEHKLITEAYEAAIEYTLNNLIK